MTISVVRRFTGANTQELQPLLPKAAAYINDNMNSIVTILSSLGGDSDSAWAVSQQCLRVNRRGCAQGRPTFSHS